MEVCNKEGEARESPAQNRSNFIAELHPLLNLVRCDERSFNVQRDRQVINNYG